MQARTWSTPGRVITIACVGAAIVTSGVQGIAPAIPAIQAHFGLTAAEVALITSLYLFPSMLSALPAGVLADRIGIRPVFSGALLVFGIGAALLLVMNGIWALLILRFVQGAAFGAVLALSVSIIGGVVASGPEAARAQGQRIVTMAAGEAVFPVAAGLLLSISWSAPFALQLLAIPAAVLAWALLPSGRPGRRAGAMSGARAITSSPAFVGVQLLGGLRFIFKFAILTYYPVLAVNEIGLSPAAVGLILGLAALITAVMAWFTKRLAGRWSSAQLIAACLVTVVVSILGMGLAAGPVLIVAAMLLFGLQDGVYGVAHNVLVTEMAPASVRSTYVGVTGTVRNVGKFVAPMAFGAATLAFTISQSFLLLAGVALVSTAAAGSVIRTQRRQDAA